MKKVNETLDDVTIEDIENHKLITDDELRRDIDNLIAFQATNNVNNFFGNPFQYHFQLKNLLQCRRENGDTIYDVWNDKEKWSKLIDSTRKRDRGGRTAAGNVYEAFRANTGSIVLFKATAAKYLYRKYGATSVLDPTAGWGGRMLGAWALGIDYTGFDTNLEMMVAYNDMYEFLCDNYVRLFEPKIRMVWQDCLSYDFSTIEYDFVLTSPPYVNMELYQHMSPWESDEQFYTEFFIPLKSKCMKHIKPGGHVCFNISPKMYDDALKYGLNPCDKEEDLIQQLGQQKGKKKQDKIYIWGKDK